MTVCVLPVLGQSGDYPKLAPFSEIKWSGETDYPRVFVDGAWYELREVNNVSFEEMRIFAKQAYPEKWQQRIGEDLVQVLSEMGFPPAKTVTLRLFQTANKLQIRFDNVAMTAENRDRVVGVRTEASDRLMNQPSSYVLAQEDIAVDLETFKQLLETRFSYFSVEETGYEQAIDEIYGRATEGMSIQKLKHELQRVLGLFIDGHSRVVKMKDEQVYLPFLMRPAGDKVAAFSPDRMTLLDEAHPYVTAIDGWTMSEWQEALRPFIPRGSDQYVSTQVLSRLRHIHELRMMLGQPLADSINVELESEDGTQSITKKVYVTPAFPTFGSWPRSTSGIMAGDIGYLRLPRMNDDAVATVKKWMPQFEHTKGLVIDVRGNTGGRRDALLALFPYFMSPKDHPYVASAAKYRLNPAFDEDHLEARFMHRADDSRWSLDDKQAINNFATSFQPVWNPPTDAFSAWHYLVLSREKDDTRYYYDKPVVVLMNDRCYSATDIFLSAFKGWRNVTLMGTASGGGSALSDSFVLPRSGLFGTLASMASFQKDGTLYDGYGVLPDVVVSPKSSYYLNDGEDRTLSRAISFLQNQ